MNLHRIGNYLSDILSLKTFLVENFPSPLIKTVPGSIDSFYHEKEGRYFAHFKINDEMLFNEFEVEKFLWKTNFGIIISQRDREICQGKGSVIIITLLILSPEVKSLSNSICRVEFINYRTKGLFRKIKFGNPNGVIFDYPTPHEAVELFTALNQFMDLIILVNEKIITL